MSDIASNLGSNLKQLRDLRGLSQLQIAKLAGIPRPTWSSLESGMGNPTIAVLSKVASALSVSIEELLSAPREVCRLYRPDMLTTKTRGAVQLRRLLPDATPGMDFDRMEIPAGARLVGVPHRTGTREYLCCESGTVTLTVAGGTWVLDSGDVLVFRGDQKHSYLNEGKRVAIAYSVVMLAPAA